MPILRAAATYFALVFGAGFGLGCVRVPLLVPRLGERTAELLELPVMLAICFAIARARQRRTAAFSARRQLAVGLLAMLFLLAAECGLGALLQARSPREVLLAHDPVSGPLYYASLLVFALLPWWFASLPPQHATSRPDPLQSPGSALRPPR